MINEKPLDSFVCDKYKGTIYNGNEVQIIIILSKVDSAETITFLYSLLPGNHALEKYADKNELAEKWKIRFEPKLKVKSYDIEIQGCGWA